MAAVLANATDYDVGISQRAGADAGAGLASAPAAGRRAPVRIHGA